MVFLKNHFALLPKYLPAFILKMIGLLLVYLKSRHHLGVWSVRNDLFPFLLNELKLSIHSQVDF